MIYYDGPRHSLESQDVRSISNQSLERGRQHEDFDAVSDKPRLGKKSSISQKDNDFDEELVTVNEETQEESTAGEGSWWSDDPVRLYMEQIGQIPLLSRQEEIDIATEVETARRGFRRGMLLCDNLL